MFYTFSLQWHFQIFNSVFCSQINQKEMHEQCMSLTFSKYLKLDLAYVGVTNGKVWRLHPRFYQLPGIVYSVIFDFSDLLKIFFFFLSFGFKNALNSGLRLGNGILENFTCVVTDDAGWTGVCKSMCFSRFARGKVIIHMHLRPGSCV